MYIITGARRFSYLIRYTSSSYNLEPGIKRILRVLVTLSTIALYRGTLNTRISTQFSIYYID